LGIFAFENFVGSVTACAKFSNNSFILKEKTQKGASVDVLVHSLARSLVEVWPKMTSRVKRHQNCVCWHRIENNSVGNVFRLHFSRQHVLAQMNANLLWKDFINPFRYAHDKL